MSALQDIHGRNKKLNQVRDQRDRLLDQAVDDLDKITRLQADLNQAHARIETLQDVREFLGEANDRLTARVETLSALCDTLGEQLSGSIDQLDVLGKVLQEEREEHRKMTLHRNSLQYQIRARRRSSEEASEAYARGAQEMSAAILTEVEKKVKAELGRG